MRLPDNQFFSVDYRVIAQNCFTKGKKITASTPPVCIPGGFLLLDGDGFSLLDGTQMSLLSTCPPGNSFALLDGTEFSLLDGTPLVLL